VSKTSVVGTSLVEVDVPPDETKSGPNVTLRGYVARSDSSPRRCRINITSAHTLQQAGNFGDFVGDQRRQVLCLPGRGYRIVVSYTVETDIEAVLCETLDAVAQQAAMG